MFELADRFSGALLGTHVGDALGMPVEGYSPHYIRSSFGEVREMLEARLGAGTYTDDTEMMIAVAESLVRKRGFDGEDMAQSFLENFDPRRGYGAGTVSALKLIRSGVRWDLAGSRVFEGGSYGNGSAMRIAPVGCLYHHDLQKLKEVAFASSSITHAHSHGKEGAALQACAVALAVRSGPGRGLDVKEYLAALKQFLDPGSVYRAKLQLVEELLQGKAPFDKVVQELGHDSRALYSVPTAIYSFLRHHEDFEEALVYAVGLGGDTDTIAAMAGAIAGGYHGKKAIPVRWLQALERGPKGANYIEELALKLCRLHREIVSP